MAGIDAGAGDAATGDAGVDASRAAFDRVYPPSACDGSPGLHAIGADGMPIELGAVNAEDARPNEPYCACTLSTHGVAGRRWATCRADESVQDCVERAGSVCDEYASPDRALGCSFAALDGANSTATPSCASVQYSVDVCDCESSETCAVYANGSHACFDTDLPLRPRGVDVCIVSPNATRFTPAHVKTNGEPIYGALCELGADCYFTSSGVATCAEPPAPHLRYPKRGCSAVSTSLNCAVWRDDAPSRIPVYDDMIPGDRPSCRMSRDEPTARWGERTWEAGDETSGCSVASLCDVEGSSSVCIDPAWTSGSGDDDVCGECFDLPCFVYEDGSYECSHAPTRARNEVDGSDESGCCRRYAGRPFDVGTCSAGIFEFESSCANAGAPCAFTQAGDASCSL